jgi:hypothetical protein
MLSGFRDLFGVSFSWCSWDSGRDGFGVESCSCVSCLFFESWLVVGDKIWMLGPYLVIILRAWRRFWRVSHCFMGKERVERSRE